MPPNNPPEDGPAPVDLDALIALIERSAFRGLMTDPQRRRAAVYETLAGSEDPIWREIGQGLRDGEMSLRDVLQVEVYRERLWRGLAEHQDAFRAAVAAAQAQLPAESDPPGRPPAGPRDGAA